MQTITKQINKLNRFRNDKRGISTVITVMLSLVLVVIIVGNVFIANFQMNQVDMNKNQENLSLTNAASTMGEVDLKLTNSSPETVHIVAVWVTSSTVHTRYPVDLFLNSGEATANLFENINLPSGNFVAKVVTERGNVAIYSSS